MVLQVKTSFRHIRRVACLAALGIGLVLSGAAQAVELKAAGPGDKIVLPTISAAPAPAQSVEREPKSAPAPVQAAAPVQFAAKARPLTGGGIQPQTSPTMTPAPKPNLDSGAATPKTVTPQTSPKKAAPSGEQFTFSSEGPSFAAALAREYQLLIARESEMYRGYFRRATFERKLEDAKGGTEVEPENLSHWTIPGDRVGQMEEGRNRLVTAIANNAKSVAPAISAKAQRYFDCWVERQGSGFKDRAIIECRNKFLILLPWVEAAVTPVKQGTAFTRAMTRDYITYADTKAWNNKDFIDARYFARKGLAAGEGTLVMPELISRWNLLQDGETPEYIESRERLVAALDGGARARVPVLASRAQVSFDCWVENTSEHKESEQIKRCRDAFLALLRQIEAPPPVAARPPRPGYIVYFDFDSARIKRAGRETVKRAAADATKRKTTDVSIYGHTDRAGSDAYNIKLSLRRAEAVKKALVKQGVPPGNIRTIAKGESDLRVETADGVPEAENRRAVIVIP